MEFRMSELASVCGCHVSVHDLIKCSRAFCIENVQLERKTVELKKSDYIVIQMTEIDFANDERDSNGSNETFQLS